MYPESHGEFIAELGLEFKFPNTSKVYIDFVQVILTNNPLFSLTFNNCFSTVHLYSPRQVWAIRQLCIQGQHNTKLTITSNLYFIPRLI